ncbi:hypothetical protein [Paenibacillus sp. DMB20]|uniref:hypothetical protein n=1 Tax=Paenibacillus sp. DMB20 TaxID=1642570 RepID=UPI000627E34F|nr:hypothetical protein [Paenibacillus sp. DMB20]KKO51144.1 hypothetical protein XI25_29600 [Paenibacillus sp. DMB20]
MKTKLVLVDVDGNEVEKEIECKPGCRMIVKYKEGASYADVDGYLRGVSRWLNGELNVLYVPHWVEITFVKFGDEDA